MHAATNARHFPAFHAFCIGSNTCFFSSEWTSCTIRAGGKSKNKDHTWPGYSKYIIWSSGWRGSRVRAQLEEHLNSEKVGHFLPQGTIFCFSDSPLQRIHVNVIYVNQAIRDKDMDSISRNITHLRHLPAAGTTDTNQHLQVWEETQSLC